MTGVVAMQVCSVRGRQGLASLVYSTSFWLPRQKSGPLVYLNQQPSTRLRFVRHYISRPSKSRGYVPHSSACESWRNMAHKTAFETEPECFVRNVLVQGIETLEQSKVDEPCDSVFHMLAHVLNLSWDTGFKELRSAYASLRAQSHQRQSIHLSVPTTTSTDAKCLLDRMLTNDEMDQWTNCIERRLKHEPIQYIVGKWDFLEHTFHVQAPLLCPRPETEELVLLARETMETKNRISWNDGTCRVLDIGCGTGCIGISLAASHPVHVMALDVDPIAVAVSNANAQQILDVSANQRYKAHLMNISDFDPYSLLWNASSSSSEGTREDPFDHDEMTFQEEGGALFDLVISNPPYIPPREMALLDSTVRDFESHVALSGVDADGMQVIRDIVQGLPEWCNPGAICWMEVHPTQPALIKKWLSSSSSLVDPEKDKSLTSTSPNLVGDSTVTRAPPRCVKFVQTVQDFAGKDRFVQLRVDRDASCNK